MKSRLKLLASAAASGLLIMSAPSHAQEMPATYDRLLNADQEPQNWLHPMQNYGAHRYSTLNQINSGNVGDLRVAYTVPLSYALVGLERTNNMAAPLVDNGYMYVDGRSGMLFKIDLTPGDHATVMWIADAEVAIDDELRTRGVAMYENAIVMALGDTRVVTVDRATGEFVWESQIGRIAGPGHSGIEPESEEFTLNPIVADGRIMVGNSAGDAGTRGWVAAVDFETGEELWRFYTVPGPGEFGHETWADEAGVSWRTGGASIWTGWSYDPELRAFIGGTAQPVPMFDPEYRPGDNLFSNSALALSIDDGELLWYFQYTPNESWDYDEQGVHMLVDAPYLGEDRSMVVHFGRNGYAYQLDRNNGEFIDAAQYVSEITWTAGLDEKTGLPIEYDPNLTLQTYIPETRWARADTAAKQACPYLPGGVRWQPPAYNRDTQIAYVGGEDGCQEFMIVPAITLENGEIDEQGRRAPGTRNDVFKGGLIAAVDVTTGELVNSVSTRYPNRSGVLSTAGNLIMTATYEGAVRAFDATTLEELWTFHTGIGIKAPVITYEVNGQQYFAVVAGERQAGDFPEEIPVRGTGAMLYVFTLN